MAGVRALLAGVRAPAAVRPLLAGAGALAGSLVSDRPPPVAGFRPLLADDVVT